MTDVLLPAWIIPEEESHEWLDEGSSVFRAAFAPGLAQRQSYGGMRLKLSRRHTVRGEEKAQLLAILKATRGAFNALRTRIHFATRGSMPTSELMSDTDFDAWTSNVTSETTVSAADRVLRIKRVANTSTNPTALSPASTGVQYAPYAGRFFLRSGRGVTLWDGRIIDVSSGAVYASTAVTLTSDGYQVCAGVPYDTDIRLGVVDRVTGKIGGDYMELWYASLSRCALIDNRPNLVQRSDELDNAYWLASGSSVSANTAQAPDGTVTGDRITEDTSTGGHWIRSSAVSIDSSEADYCLSCSAIAGTGRNWVALIIQETTGSTFCTAFFNLSAGSVGTVSVGANWADARAFIVDMGNGWYDCFVIGRKTNAATTIYGFIQIADADNSLSYTGDGSSHISAWRASLSQSSLPIYATQTTSAASTGTDQTGSNLYVKGLPASTSGLLLPGDWFEINGELKECTASLNSDASGRGYLQFEPPLVRSPSDNDAVIFKDPMGKFLVSNVKIDNEFGTQARVSYDLEHIYE